jgi:hypothetical protein
LDAAKSSSNNNYPRHSAPGPLVTPKELWAVTKIREHSTPTGEKLTDLAIVRVDTEKPCEVSKYAVGGVLTFNTSLFDAGQKRS